MKFTAAFLLLTLPGVQKSLSGETPAAAAAAWWDDDDWPCPSPSPWEAREEEEEDDDDEVDNDVRRAPERRPRQVELRRDCPYLDTVNRQVWLLAAAAFQVPIF